MNTLDYQVANLPPIPVKNTWNLSLPVLTMLTFLCYDGGILHILEGKTMKEFNPDEFNKEETWRKLSGTAGTWYQDAVEDERTAFRDWTRGLLHEREVNLTFTKADGTLRTMKCTLNEGLGAPTPINTTTERKVNEAACAVWDCEKDEWRSFRWDRINRIEFTI